MEFRASDSGGVSMATTKLQLVVVVVEETSQQASGTVDFEVGTAATTQKDSTEKTTALDVAATASIDLTNLFFLLRDERRRWGGWTCGISVLFAFAALLSAAGLVLVVNTTAVGVSAARRRRVILVASAAALFVASAGTVILSLLDLDAWCCGLADFIL